MANKTNKSWIEKADLAVADIISDGGFLNAEQTEELFEIAIEQSVLMQLATVKPMKASEFEISKAGFTGRVLRPKVESQALAEGDRSKPELGQSVLSVKGFIAEARIPYDALEDHVSQDNLLPEIKRLLGKAIARDIDDNAINGDTASLVNDLTPFDGILKQAVSEVVAAGGVRLTKSVLKQMAQTMPSQYFDENMVYITSKNAAIDFSDSLSNRQTEVGDDTLTKATKAHYAGHPVIMVPKFPEDLGGGSDETNVLLLDPKNIWIGMQRQVLIETAKDISAQKWIVVASLKFDVKFAHEPAVVKATGVLASAAP